MTIIDPSPVLIDPASACITIWQPYFAICAYARTPYCAAAILDLLENHPPATPEGWIIMAYEDIHGALFGAFWLDIVKHHVRWLIQIGYVECLHDPDREYGLQAYRLNAEVIEQAFAALPR